MSTNFKRRIINKVAAYSISLFRDQPDTRFTNYGAVGEVVLTLPTPGPQYLGVTYQAKGLADQIIGFTGANAGDLVTKHDLAANSVKAQTAGEMIGAVLEAECIRTADSTYKWVVAGISVGHTFTVTT